MARTTGSSSSSSSWEKGVAKVVGDTVNSINAAHRSQLRGRVFRVRVSYMLFMISFGQYKNISLISPTPTATNRVCIRYVTLGATSYKSSSGRFYSY